MVETDAVIEPVATAVDDGGDRPDLLSMDRLWRALVANRPQNTLLIPVSQSEMAHEVKVTFEELGCNKLAGRIRKVLRRQPRAPPRRHHGRTVFPWTGHRCFVEIGNTPARVGRAIKRHGVPAEIWSCWYGTVRDVAQSDKKAQLVHRIRRGTIAGILLTPPGYALSTSRREKPRQWVARRSPP